jgi:hypothetical protein
MQLRRRFKQDSPLEARLEKEAERLRDRANELPPGVERERLLQRVREIERTCEMVEWINSPGLKPPS